MTKSYHRYQAPDISWDEMTVKSMLCESGEIPDYEPITDFEW